MKMPPLFLSCILAFTTTICFGQSSVSPAPSAPEPKAQAEFVTFTDSEVLKKKSEIEAAMPQAEHWAHYNQAWDLTFKIAVMILTAGGGFAGAMVAARAKDNPLPGWVSGLAAGGSILVTAITAFAFTQINFAARAGIYYKQLEALRYLKVIVDEKPIRADFNTAFVAVTSWNDSTPVNTPIPQVKSVSSRKDS